MMHTAFNKIDNILSLQNREQRAEIIALANSFQHLPSPITPDIIQRLIALENKIHSVIQYDKKWFFANVGDVDTETFARDMSTLHGTAAKTLVLLVGRVDEWTPLDNPPQDKPYLRELISFAMYHYGAMIKWSFFRREPINNAIWPKLHKLYQFAESQELNQSPITLFAAESAYETSIASLYIRALMLDLLHTGSLNMAQIEIADGWLAAWAPQYHLDQQRDIKLNPLLVDLDSLTGLQLSAKTNNAPNPRHLRIDAIKGQLDAARESLRNGRPYEGRGIQNLFSMEEHVALLTKVERLYATMLDAAAKGIEARKAVANKSVAVMLGVEAIAATLVQALPVSNVQQQTSAPEAKVEDIFTLSLEPMPSDYPEPAINTAGDDALHENPNWKLTDISPSGMGFIVENGGAKRLQVGSLIAVKIFDAGKPAERWIVATVARKVEQTESKNTMLGVEILSIQPVGVRLQRYDATNHVNNQVSMLGALDALYIPGDDSRGRHDKLLIPFNEIGADNQDSTYQLTTTSATFVVRLNRALRKGTDWLMFGYEVLKKHG